MGQGAGPLMETKNLQEGYIRGESSAINLLRILTKRSPSGEEASHKQCEAAQGAWRDTVFATNNVTAIDHRL